MDKVASTACALLAFASATMAEAAVTLPFASAGAEYHSATTGSGILEEGGSTGYAWTKGDYVRQGFADTGLGSAASIVGSFDIETNLFSPLGLRLLVNGVSVGWIDIDMCGDCGEQQTISYRFNFAPIAGDDFDLELRWINTILDGDGSIAVFDGGSATLSDQRVPIPEPTTWALLVSGFALVGLAMRRRALPA